MALMKAVAAAATTVLALTAGPALADTWPTKPITLLVPFSAGGPTDFIARLVAEPLSRELGQQVIVQNKPGASGNVGYQSVLNGPADGYTLMHNTVGMQAINPLMYPSAKMDPLKDYVPIGTTGTMPNLLVVNPERTPVATLADLVARGRAAPHGLSYATFGPGSSPHVYGALLQKLAKFQAVVAKLRTAVANVVANEAYRKAMQERGAEALSVAPAQLDDFFKRETAQWTDAANAVGLKAE